MSVHAELVKMFSTREEIDGKREPRVSRARGRQKEGRSGFLRATPNRFPGKTYLHTQDSATSYLSEPWHVCTEQMGNFFRAFLQKFQPIKLRSRASFSLPFLLHVRIKLLFLIRWMKCLALWHDVVWCVSMDQRYYRQPTRFNQPLWIHALTEPRREHTAEGGEGCVPFLQTESHHSSCKHFCHHRDSSELLKRHEFSPNSQCVNQIIVCFVCWLSHDCFWTHQS